MSERGPQLELTVLLAQGGDDAAFSRMVEACHVALVRHARRYLADLDLARDAVQDAWCDIVRALPRLDDPARFMPWALRIVTRRAIDVVRKRGRTAGMTGGGIDVGQLAAAGGTGSDDCGELLVAVQRLDFDHRVVVELHYLEQLPLPEVADVLSIPVGTIKSRLHHARQRLRKIRTGGQTTKENDDG